MTQTRTDIGLVPFAATHLDGALALSREAGWPHRKADWALSLALSDGVVALEEGRVVGTALATRFGDIAALNLIIVAADQRGRGLGWRLMNAVIARAQGCELRLCATADGFPLYQKLGFVATGEVFQHQGIALAPAQPVAAQVADIAAFGPCVAADAAAFGASRRDLLLRIAQEGTLLSTEGGYALLRDFGRGKLVGPIAARDRAAAEHLLSEAARLCEGQFLRIDLPDTAADLRPLAQTLGLAPVGGGVAMKRDVHPARPASDYQTYALASQALG